MSTRRFSDKVVVVTGAAQGIGCGVMVAAAEEGAYVLLVNRIESIHEVQVEIAVMDGHARAAMADLETYAGAQYAVQTALGVFGRIDAPINNVGDIVWTKPYQHYEKAQIEVEIRCSPFPTLWCCRAVLPHMVERKQGVIMNVSSTATHGIYRVPYPTAKGGVNALAASLALERADDNIRVNVVATGGTEAPPRKISHGTTPMSKQEIVQYQDIVDQTLASSLMHRYGTIDEQVRTILFLALDEASYTTGTVLPIGGGDLG